MMYLIFYVNGLYDSGTHIYEFWVYTKSRWCSCQHVTCCLNGIIHSPFPLLGICCINNCGVLPFTKGIEALSPQEYWTGNYPASLLSLS